MEEKDKRNNYQVMPASTKEWHRTLIADYEWDKGKERILSSSEEIEACLQRLNT